MILRLLVLLFLCSSLFANQHSDTIVVEKSSREFSLPGYFIEPGSISVGSPDSVQLPPWRFYFTSGVVRFDEALPEGRVVVFEYQTMYNDLKKQFSFYKPTLYDSTKAVERNPELTISELKPQKQNITLSGEKSVGVALGQGGEFTMDQTLDVQIYGDIGDSTRLSANISDQSTSLDGDTKEIGELDRIFLSITNPRWYATVGDLDLRTDPEGILKSKKAPKGIEGGYNGNWGSASLYGAVSAHRLAVEHLTGISGVQSGAYIFKGNGEPGQILPIEGTVVVRVEGEELLEGSEGQYRVDYSTGQLTFNTSYTILDDDIIEIRYRYRVFNYSKLIAGLSYSKGDETSPLKIASSFHIENDNINSSDISLTQEELDSLEQSGDAAPQILSGRKVHPNDVVTESARNRLYELNSESSFYTWNSYPEYSAHIKDLYLVTYTEVEDSGEYLPYSDENRPLFTDYTPDFLDSAAEASRDSLFLKPVYLYVGYEHGTHSAYQTAALPERALQGEVRVRLEPSEQFKMETVIAGRHRDKNTLSTLNDNDNNSAGVRSSAELSTPIDNMFVFSTGIEGEYAGKEFTQDITDRYSLKREWGLPVDSSRYKTIKGEITGTWNKKISLGFNGGTAHVDNSPFSNILSTNLGYNPIAIWRNNYRYLQRFADTLTAEPGRRQELNSEIKGSIIHARLYAEEEWLQRTKTVYSGRAKGGFSILVPHWNWNNRIEYQRKSSGDDKHVNSIESGNHFLWEQSLDQKIKDNRDINLTSSFLKQKGEEELTSLLLSLRHQARYLDSRIATELGYTLNSENAIARRWQYIFVGEGIGTHVRDTLTGEFLPAPFGDYKAEEITLWGDGEKKTVQNSFLYRWSYKTPSKGTSADGLSFEGIVSSQEDIVPDKDGITRAWIPIISSFSPTKGDTVSYSNMHYTQRMLWYPTQLPGISSTLTATIRRKVDIQSEFKTLEGSWAFKKEWKRFHLGGTLSGISEKRNINHIKDAQLIPLQEVPIGKSITIFLEEILGETALDSLSGSYYGLRPGVRFDHPKVGLAEFSYTAANLEYEGPVLYPMANELSNGMNHRFFLRLNFNAQKHINLNGYFRADYTEADDWRVLTSLRAIVKI